MKYLPAGLIPFLFFLQAYPGYLFAQVPVRKEPRHHPVLETSWFRLLDVIIPPGDTSEFHIHATPSLFLVYNSRDVASQVMGKGWLTDHSVAGNCWYRSFVKDTLVHRVCNKDSLPFNVNDIELLQPFGNGPEPGYKKLPFPVIFENEKAIAYSILKPQQNLDIPARHLPMIAALVEGDNALFTARATNQSTQITAGQFFYFPPGEPYAFSVQGKGEVRMVIFEIK